MSILLGISNAPIFGIDVKGRVNEWNDKTAEITGYSKDEAVNKPLGEGSNFVSVIYSLVYLQI